MEKLNYSQGENINTNRENLGNDLRGQILSEIQDLENQKSELEVRMGEDIRYMREANRSEMDIEDIYDAMTEIFGDKMRYYDDRFYDIDVKIHGLKFKLSKIDNDN